MFKKFPVLLIALLFSVPACKNKKKNSKVEIKHEQTKKIKTSEVNIPLSGSNVDMNEDEDLEGFFSDEEVENTTNTTNLTLSTEEKDSAIAQLENETEFKWIEATDETDMKTVYFDFDKYGIREDQKENVSYDLEQIKEFLAQARQSGQEPTVVIEGHADHAAGTEVYNLALSENRAKTVADVLTSNGVPKDNIKVIGRGQAVPAIIEGKKVTGNRTQQWPNRRVQVHIITT